jgi:hypothetical protein
MDAGVNTRISHESAGGGLADVAGKPQRAVIRAAGAIAN